VTSENSPRRPRRSNGPLLDTVEELATGVARLGYGMLSIGLDPLPRQSRQHMHNAVRELSHAFATLPGDFAEVEISTVSTLGDSATLSDAAGAKIAGYSYEARDAS
jgi:hypothetical protein